MPSAENPHRVGVRVIILMARRLCAFVGLSLTLTATTVLAHHSFAPFEMEKGVTLTGTLTKVDWRNPHIEISIEIKNDQGQLESWRMEGGPPDRFARRGISKDRFTQAIGQTVTVEAGLAKDGARQGHMLTIVLPDGTKTPAR